MKNKPIIKKYDENNNCIYYKYSDNYEIWREYDENNNEIHCKNNYGEEAWKEYDKNNNLIHYKASNGGECWYKYNEYNKQTIIITEQEFKQIERDKEKRKLYFNNKKINRFSLMDI